MSIFTPAIYALAIVGLSASQAVADPVTLPVPVDEGYGVTMEACAEVGFDCRRIVADAWCEANGFERSAHVDASHPRPSRSARVSALVVACE